MGKKIYLFSGTHWDREWYQTLQGFRLDLVEVLDELIDYLEGHSEFEVFHLDGQTIVLDDYVEIAPENRERLQKLIAQGRIRIGPWFTMPDEFTVSGEALIRNLILGHRKTENYGGKPWKCGYICDVFGHIGQMPQILCGFGIDCAVLGRGTCQGETDTYFVWRAYDGSEVVCYKVPEFSGYGAFSMEVAGERAAGVERGADSPEFERRCREFADREIARSNLPVVILPDAMDHESVHPMTQRYLKRIAAWYPGYEVRQGDLLEAFSDVRAYAESLQKKQGELNRPGRIVAPYQHLLPHTLSSRCRVKRENDLCDTLLVKGLEPLGVLYAQIGYHIRQSYLERLWEILLTNHSHDSICGCAQDRVHREMFYRYSQIESFYEAFCQRAERAIAGGFHLAGEEGGWLCLVNSLAYECRRYVEVTVPFSRDFPKWHEPFGYEELPAFRLYDGEAEVPYAVLGRDACGQVRVIKAELEKADLVKVGLTVDLPPLSVKSLRIRPQNKPVRFFGSMFRKDAGAMDNGRIRVKILADGSVELFDYATNKAYPELIRYVDDSEIGDGWFSVRSQSDSKQLVCRLEGVETVSDSPALAAVRVTQTLSVPARMAYGERRYERQGRTELRIVTTLKLAAGSPALSVETSVFNNAEDHRLRLVLPTGVEGDYEANQAFAFVRRPPGRDGSTADWKESDAPEKAMSGIVLKRDESGAGLAFVSRYGLKECAADEYGTLYITLFRCFSKTFASNGEPEGQEQGELRFEYELRPLSAEVSEGELQREQDILQAPVPAFVSDRSVDLPPALGVKGEVCVSAVKFAEEGNGDVVLRLYNPSGEAQTAEITGGLSARKALRCDLAERIQGACAKKLTLRPYEIATFRLVKGED